MQHYSSNASDCATRMMHNFIFAPQGQSVTA